MSEINFSVEQALPLNHAVSPTLILKLRCHESARMKHIQNVVLQVQIQIETVRRKYSQDEQSQLLDLFGTPDRWGETLRSLHWTRTSVLVPAFSDSIVVDLQIPCSYDFNLAATKYFYAVEEGEIPLLLLFSGTVFYREEDGSLQVMQIPWSKETRFRLPVQTWKQMIDFYYPNSAWLVLRLDVFDRLYRFKCEQGIPTWEQTLDSLLDLATQEDHA